MMVVMEPFLTASPRFFTSHNDKRMEVCCIRGNPHQIGLELESWWLRAYKHGKFITMRLVTALISPLAVSSVFKQR